MIDPMDPGLSQQLGRIEGTLDSLMDGQRERTRIAEKQHDELSAEIRNVKHDYRNVEQRIEVVVADIKAVAVTGRRTEERVKKLEGPVAELIGLRSKIIGGVVVLSALGSILAWFISPVVEWAKEHILK